MAEIQDIKRTFYSSTQSAKDEANAVESWESAGDILIKDLARKQTSTSTTLEEQLEVKQNFEKGFDLTPCVQEGICTFQEFKSNVQKEEVREHDQTAESHAVEDVEEIQRRTGLSRHELEVALVEKPNSEISKLYKFALSNKRDQVERSDLRSKLAEHPINHLKEIEQEYFGHLKPGKTKEDSVGNDLLGDVNESGNEEVIPNKKKKKKHRKRKRKTGSAEPGDLNTVRKEVACDLSDDVAVGPPSCRPSLWDVKDMKKWSEARTKGCKPQNLYTVKDGQIVKLNESDRPP